MGFNLEFKGLKTHLRILTNIKIEGPHSTTEINISSVLSQSYNFLAKLKINMFKVDANVWHYVPSVFFCFSLHRKG